MTEGEYIAGRQDSPLKRGKPHHKLLLVKKLRLYKESKSLTYEALYREIEMFHLNEKSRANAELDFSSDYLKKLLSVKNSELNPSTAVLNLLYRFLDDSGGWDSRTASRDAVSDTEDHLYFSMLEFLEIPELTTSNLLQRLPGVYRVYRPILTHPGKYVVGVIIVRSNEETGLLSYSEHNAIQRLEGREAKSVTFRGYAFRKSNFLFFVSTDSAKSAIHTTMLSSCEVQEDKYITMLGGFMDTLGGQVYSGKVFIERISGFDEKQIDVEAVFSQSKCVSASQLPPSIETYFSEKTEKENLTIY